MGYSVLEAENLPEELQNKPKWVACVAFATGLLMITTSAVAVGAFIGYTYCYIENRSVVRSGNVTQSTNFQIVQMPLPESGTVNVTSRPLISSVIVSRILKLGHALMEEDLGSFLWPHEDANAQILQQYT